MAKTKITLAVRNKKPFRFESNAPPVMAITARRHAEEPYLIQMKKLFINKTRSKNKIVRIQQRFKTPVTTLKILL